VGTDVPDDPANPIVSPASPLGLVRVRTASGAQRDYARVFDAVWVGTNCPARRSGGSGRRSGWASRGGGHRRRALAVVTFLAVFAWKESRRAKRLAELNGERLVRLSVAYGDRLMEGGDLLSALQRFVEALKHEGNPSRQDLHRRRIATVLQQCPRLPQVWWFDVDVNDVRSVRWPMGGLRLADGTVSIWDAEGKPAGRRSTTPRCRVGFLPSGRPSARDHRPGWDRARLDATGNRIRPWCRARQGRGQTGIGAGSIGQEHPGHLRRQRPRGPLWDAASESAAGSVARGAGSSRDVQPGWPPGGHGQ
jgi:hypothetical protein